MTSARPERLLGTLIVLVLVGVLVALGALSADPAEPSATASRDPDAADGGPNGPTEQAEVLRVVDGDTILVRIGDRQERVRYIGLNAPEIGRVQEGTPAECGGDAARTANERLAVGEDILLERDVSDRDRFGRLLRHAWRDDGGWRLIGLELVETGVVEARSYAPDTTRDAEFDAAERRAREAGSGLWGAC